MLFGPTGRRGLSYDCVLNLHIPAMFESFVQARVPQHEHVQIFTVGRQHSEPAAGVIKGRIFSNGLPRYSKDGLELARATLASDYQ